MATKSNLKPMPSVWRSLLWKEWQEYRWHLLWLTVAIVLLPLFFVGDLHPESLLVVANGVLACYGILAGLFVGMETAARENQRGTMRFLQSLPVSMTKLATARLAVSCLTVIVPVLVGVGCLYAYLFLQQYHPLDVANMLDWTRIRVIFSAQETTTLAGYASLLTLMSSLFTISLLVWMATCGVNRSDEIRAGAIGFLVMVCVWAVLLSTLTWAERSGWRFVENCLLLLLAGAPGGPGFIGNLSSAGFGRTWPYVVFATLTHAALIYVFLRRYGRGSVRPERTSGERATKSQTEWLSPPRKSQFTAIIWKQVNETGPLAIVAAAAVLLIAGILSWLDNVQVRNYSETLAGTALGVGYLVTVVAGMGVFLEDVKPKIGGFWRSRPVNTTQWFFVKFFTGLTVLAVCFGTLFVIASLLPGGQRLFEEVDGLQLAVFALLFVLTYAIAMASYCLGRHPIAAACSTVGIMLSGAFGYGVLVDRDVIRSEVEIGIGLMLVGLVAAITLAWLALRNNWGWHGR